jgi:imidazolonepropionase-like amidohydrolase
VALLWACGPDAPELVRAPATPPSALLIRNVGVLDVVRGAIDRGVDVLVQGDRIAAIGLSGRLRPPDEAEVIDGQGGTLLPGLIDMHGHVYTSPAPPWRVALPDPSANLRSYLYSGVTTVLDPADSSNDAYARRDQVARGELLGPRIYTAGKPVTAPEGHPIAMIRIAAPWWIAWYAAPRSASGVSSPDEARAAVKELAADGSDFVKVIVDRIPQDAPRLGFEEVRTTVETAREHGLRSVAHIGSLEDARDAARAGVALWVHGVYKERIADAAIPELAGFGIPMVPTLVVFENYAAALDGNREASALERQTAPAELLASFNQRPDHSPLLDAFRSWLEELGQLRPAWRDNVRRLHESGLTRAEAIRAATLDPARFLTRSDDPDFGQVRLGKRADLLLVDGDPTADLAALEDIREVILGGVRLERLPIGE